jgi:hypothetical protein
MEAMNFIREFFLVLLDPDRDAKENELAQRRAADQRALGGLRNRQWYRLVNNGSQSGFMFLCGCGREFRLLQPFEWFRDYACKQCGDEFKLLKDAGVPRGTDPQHFERYLAKLPVYQIGGQDAQQRKSPHVNTWDDGNDGTVEWEGSEPRDWV